MTQPFTYRIQFIPTGEYYYGVRYRKGCQPSDLWNKYFTSSKKVKNLIRKFGKDCFTIEIRKTFKYPEEAILWEHRVNRYTKEWTNYLNESDAKHQGSKYSSSGGLVSKNQKSGLHNPKKPWLKDSTKVDNIKQGNLKGGKKTGSMPWWNNGVRDTKSIECPGEGWISGMMPKGHYWNNGMEQKVSNQSPGSDWVRGGLNRTVNGREWWNNGTEQRMVFEQPAADWNRGKLSGSADWWNNGTEQTRQKEYPGPGWQRGMLKKIIP